MTKTVLIQQIDAILPQTQCTKCGYEGCLPYATAIAEEQAPINRCPPGGESGIDQLATLLDTPALPLDTSCGQTQPLHWAVIDEAHCIGCTLCIRACPVDAIIGANKFMHTVVADLCSGCELCVPTCPVDCIQMVPANKEWTKQAADEARTRHQHRAERLALQAKKEEARLNQHSSLPNDSQRFTAQVTEPYSANEIGSSKNTQSASQKKSAAIAMALARARARRQAS